MTPARVAAILVLLASLCPPAATAASILFDNGPFVTGVGTGANGANISVLSASMDSFGFSVSAFSGNRIADDFVIPAGAGWDISTIDFFAYQTGAGSGTSTFQSLNLRIWNGPPTDAASTVVWGESANILTASEWSGTYRVDESGQQSTSRPIFRNTAAVNTHFAPGTYWLDWKAGGSLSSGPWAPPITISGVTATGNALHWTASSGAWGPVLDDANVDRPQGIPFVISGDDASLPEPGTLALMGAGFGLLAIARKYRRPV